MSENLNKKLAIVLFNLGGPDRLTAVKSFLFNLFYDPRIINLPNPFRFLIAKFITFTRENTAKAIYAELGGKSPILDETIAQQQALTNLLAETIKSDFKIFICMRYWHPRAKAVVNEIQQYNPEEIILLPLYPQFSTTTTASSIEEFMFFLQKIHPTPSVKTICCYPVEHKLIMAHVSLIQQAITKLKDNFRVLFSAHSLPVRIIEKGDPYQWQIEETVKHIIKYMNDDLDYRITYQSKVGPIKWLTPDTKKEIEIAAGEGKSLIIVPIAFVSEHVETLVELDIEYKKIAEKCGIKYLRISTLRCNELFIQSLTDIIQNFLSSNSITCASSNLERICPQTFIKCPSNHLNKSIEDKIN